MAKVQEGSTTPQAPAAPVQPALTQPDGKEPIVAVQPDDFEARRQAALNRAVKAREGEDADQPGVNANDVPETPAAGGVRQILHAVQTSEGPIGDIEMFDMPGQHRAPRPREQWHNPTDVAIVVGFNPAFRVRPGGTFSIERAYHEAVHNIAPQLVCSRGGADCPHAKAHAQLEQRIEDEVAERKLARTFLADRG